MIDKWAVCLKCGAPLVSTFEVRKKEWICVPCNEYVEFLHVNWKEPNRAMKKLHKQLSEQYWTARAEREAANG